ncbi:MAG: biopolymer transporter ExbD [Pirellulaceae bacterium]
MEHERWPFKSKSQATSTLSLTPLIDVVFLLLIFFLVASRFAQEDRRMPIELPSATSATPMTEQPKGDRGRY